MGSKHAKQHQKTGCGYGYLPVGNLFFQFGNSFSFLNSFNFNPYINNCGIFPFAFPMPLAQPIIKPFNYELKTKCFCCNGKLKVKNEKVINKCKCYQKPCYV